MINVTVINLRTLIKYFIIACILTCIFFFIKTVTDNKNQNESKILSVFENMSFVSCLDETLPKIDGNNKIAVLEESRKSVSLQGFSLKQMLSVELGAINTLSLDKENEIENKNETKPEQVIKADTNVETSQINENNITPKYNTEYGSVKIKNESSKEINIDILTPNISLENKKDVIIFHTHTCESYTPTEQFNYVASGTYRTIDLNYSVARVGTELTNQLSSYGFNVIHDQTYHDYPEYSGSYGRSLQTVKNILSTNSTTQIIIDLHRDAVGSMPNYAPSVKIGDEVVAQLMFVIGTDGGGLQHLNWQDNLKFAVKVQQKANELYPGLFRPIIVRNSRYNQHLSKAATIIEVGATGNTMEQCMASMKYLAKVLDEINK